MGTFPPVASAQNAERVGWVEKVRIYPANLVLQAKLDTGADSSSLDAASVVEFERKGREWVRFTVANRYGQSAVIEKEVRRTVLIKRHKGQHQRRKVVRMGICLGETYLETDVNLVDRRHFEYQMLLGRTFLAGNAVIDPAVTYTSEPRCKTIGQP